MSTQLSDTGDGRLGEEAAAWVVRLAGDEVAEADALAFIAWLDGSPAEAPDRHRQAFDRAQAVWFAADGLSALRPALKTRSHGFRPARQPALARFAWAAVAASCATLALSWLLRSRPPVERPQLATSVSYVTLPGERRRLSLADGSHLDMDGATTLSLNIDGGARRAVLGRGEVSFDVKHDAAHPFTVDLGSAEVRVLGTAFDIVREPDTLTVQVARGAVSLTGDAATIRLTAGQGAQFAPGGAHHFIAVPAVDVGAWRYGMRLYRDQPLPEVVSDLNRGFAQPLRLADAGVRRLRFTGVLALGPRETVVRRLTALLPLDARLQTNGVIMLGSRRP